jgi:hypothetical protein
MKLARFINDADAELARSDRLDGTGPALAPSARVPRVFEKVE